MGDRLRESWHSLRLVGGDLAADRVRSLLTIGALVPLVFAYFIVAAIAQGLLGVADIQESESELVMLSPNILDISIGTVDDAAIAIAAEAAGPELVAISPLVVRTLLVDESVIQLRAADVATWESQHGLTLTDGGWPSEFGEVLATEPLLAISGWRVGDAIPIFGSEFRISGVARAPGTKAVSVWMPLSQADRLFGMPGEYQAAFIRVAPGADTDAVAARIEAAPEIGTRYVVIRESSLALAEADRTKAIGDIANVFVLMAVALIGFGTFHFASMTLAERETEVGVLRTLGFSAKTVRRMAAQRTLIIASIAFVIGGLLAWSYLLTQPDVGVVGFAVPIEVDVRAVLIGVVLIPAVAWLGTRLATRRLLSMNVGELVER